MNGRRAIALRIFVGEDKLFHQRPLYEAIVLKAREMHLHGATVLRGQLGFGRSKGLHRTKVLRLAQDLPLIVEIVDTKERIETFLPVLDRMMSAGLLTMAEVEIADDGGSVNV
jgi:PII-like signaling protein